MSRFKANPFVGILILTTVLALGVEAWLLRLAYQQARRANVQLLEKVRELAVIQQRSPAPNETNERAILHELAGLQEKLAAAHSTLAGGQRSTSNPAKSVDAYFELAAFGEEMRRRAIRAQVKIRPNEHFGFGSHVTDGPASGLIESVFQQRLATEFLFGALLEARPEEFFSLRRESPVVLMQRTARAEDGRTEKPASTRDDATDFFEFPAWGSVRKPGEIETGAFALEFSGQTRVLRDFLNRLAESGNAVVVRSVEVDPIRNQKIAPGLSPVSETAVPIVAQDISRFTVIVEWIVPAAVDEKASL